MYHHHSRLSRLGPWLVWRGTAGTRCGERDVEVGACTFAKLTDSTTELSRLLACCPAKLVSPEGNMAARVYGVAGAGSWCRVQSDIGHSHTPLPLQIPAHPA